MFRKDGTVTAGNASGINDGAAAVLLASRVGLDRVAITEGPLARFVGAAAAGVEPSLMGTGPIPATRKLLGRLRLAVADLDLIEINEAFAAQVLPCIRELGLDPERVNVNGGAIAIGHPLGCSGARLLATLAHELHRRRAARGPGHHVHRRGPGALRGDRRGLTSRRLGPCVMRVLWLWASIRGTTTLPRDPKITPITRHDPRTFYATRVTRTQAGEAWDLWSVEDGRRVGFLSVVDDGHVVYAMATVKKGTSHEEVADLVEGFFTASSTDAHSREIIIADYEEEPEMLESDIRQGWLRPWAPLRRSPGPAARTGARSGRRRPPARRGSPAR